MNGVFTVTYHDCYPLICLLAHVAQSTQVEAQLSGIASATGDDQLSTMVFI